MAGVTTFTSRKEIVMPFLHLVLSGSPDADRVDAIASGLIERTVRVLRKRRDVTSVAVTFVAPERWFVGGRSLRDHGLTSFWLDIKVTESTNTKDEKARYLQEVFSFLREMLGPLHDESYILVHDVRADAYGYGGETQESRYVRGTLAGTA
jgi:4-oxalocrotonate tautomerase